MSNRTVKHQSLNISLLKERVTLKEAIKPNLRKFTLQGIGVFYCKQNPRHPPKWLSFFKGTLAGHPNLHNQGNGAVLAVTRGMRTFVISFGLGRHLLEPGKIEDCFGLRVTLNCVDPNKLKSVDRRTFDAISCQTRTQASQEGDVAAFGLNVERDLLRAATGWVQRMRIARLRIVRSCQLLPDRR